MPGRMGDGLGIRLSEAERARIGAWVKGGARRLGPAPAAAVYDLLICHATGGWEG